MKEIVDFGRSLSDPIRVRILNALAQGELCVCELVDILELNQSTLSTHLQTLRSAGIVTTEKRRRWVIYSIEANSLETIRTVFDRLKPNGERIEHDNSRFRSRIRLRVDGCCVLGAGQLSKELVNA